MLENIKLVIFDMDGVLVDSEHRYLQMQQEVLRMDGLHVKIEDLYPLVGLDWDNHFDYIVSLYDREKSVEEARRDLFGYYETIVVDYSDWGFPKVEETLNTLRDRGIDIALASNSDYKDILQVIDQMGISHYFSKINSAEFFDYGKPHPMIYLDVVESLGYKKDEVVVIEDSMSGIAAAKAAGLKVYAILDTRFDIDQSGADRIISELSDVFDKIDLDA